MVELVRISEVVHHPIQSLAGLPLEGPIRMAPPSPSLWKLSRGMGQGSHR